jgi:cell division protein FtsZ
MAPGRETPASGPDHARAASASGVNPAGGTLPEYIRNAPGPDHTPAPAGSSSQASRSERVSVAAEAETPSYRPAHADGPPKTFDVPSTRRRPVVFEEDDDLDVPDFLK